MWSVQGRVSLPPQDGWASSGRSVPTFWVDAVSVREAMGKAVDVLSAGRGVDGEYGVTVYESVSDVCVGGRFAVVDGKVGQVGEVTALEG